MQCAMRSSPGKDPLRRRFLTAISSDHGNTAKPDRPIFVCADCYGAYRSPFILSPWANKALWIVIAVVRAQLLGFWRGGIGRSRTYASLTTFCRRNYRSPFCQAMPCPVSTSLKERYGFQEGSKLDERFPYHFFQATLSFITFLLSNVLAKSRERSI